MAGQQQPRLPRLEPQECRRQAEEFLGHGEVDVDVPRALAYGLLALAGEAHAIRMQLRKR